MPPLRFCPSRLQTFVADAAFAVTVALTAGTAAGADGQSAPTTAATTCTVSAKLVPSCGALLGVSTETGLTQTWGQAVSVFEQKTGHPADLLHNYHLWDSAFPDAAGSTRAASGQKHM